MLIAIKNINRKKDVKGRNKRKAKIVRSNYICIFIHVGSQNKRGVRMNEVIKSERAEAMKSSVKKKRELEKKGAKVFELRSTRRLQSRRNALASLNRSA